MKYLVLLLALFSSPQVLALYCSCDVYALTPMRMSHAVLQKPLETWEGRFYGDTTEDSGKECRAECLSLARKNFDEAGTRERLLSWVDTLIAEGHAGRNCATEDSFKVPVRMRARLGNKTLGLVRSQTVFIHHTYRCI